MVLTLVVAARRPTTRPGLRPTAGLCALPVRLRIMTMDTSTGIRELIAACIDDENTLSHESAFVDDRCCTVLVRLAAERAEFAIRLRSLERVSPESRVCRGSRLALLRELARGLRVLAGGPNNGDSITECRHAQRRTEQAYDRANALTWPTEIRRVLLDQGERVHHARGELIGLLS